MGGFPLALKFVLKLLLNDRLKFWCFYVGGISLTLGRGAPLFLVNSCLILFMPSSAISKSYSCACVDADKLSERVMGLRATGGLGFEP